jgi:hypothetical protein
MYIKRDTTGSITTASLDADGGTAEFIADDSPELLEFMETNKPEAHQLLKDSDAEIARVMEDVINLLIDKGTIQFTELPTTAQKKLLSRRSARGKVQGMNLLDDEDVLEI